MEVETPGGMRLRNREGSWSSRNRAVNRGAPRSFRFLSLLSSPSTFRRAEIMGCENRKDPNEKISTCECFFNPFASDLSRSRSISKIFVRFVRIQCKWRMQVISLLVYITRNGIIRILIRRASLNLTTTTTRLASRVLRVLVFEGKRSSPRDPLYHFSPSRVCEITAPTRSRPEWLTTTRGEKSGDSHLTEFTEKLIGNRWCRFEKKFYRWRPPSSLLSGIFPHSCSLLTIFRPISPPTSVTFRPWYSRHAWLNRFHPLLMRSLWNLINPT